MHFLFFRIVTFIFTSSGTLPPQRRIALREGDIVVRDEEFIGRYYTIGRIGLFYKIDAATLEPGN